jgi:hypothetical protein
VKLRALQQISAIAAICRRSSADLMQIRHQVTAKSEIDKRVNPSMPALRAVTQFPLVDGCMRRELPFFKPLAL